jgi:hypothetical protein
MLRHEIVDLTSFSEGGAVVGATGETCITLQGLPGNFADWRACRGSPSCSPKSSSLPSNS